MKIDGIIEVQLFHLLLIFERYARGGDKAELLEGRKEETSCGFL
jgi:hypothetical protein